MNSYPAVFLSSSLLLSAVTLLFLAASGLLRSRYSPNWIYRIFLFLTALWLLPFWPRLELPSGLFPASALSAEKGFPFIPSDGIQRIPSALQNAFTVPSARTGLSFQTIFCTIWLCGIAAVILYYVFRQVQFARFVKRWSLPVTDGKLLDLFEEVKISSGIKKDLGLALCRSIATPMLAGLLRPVILLPAETFASYTHSQLGHILTHECVHFRQKDLPARLVILAATAVHWFNPVVWLLSRTTSLQCEMACDDLALKGMDLYMRKEYGKIIIDVIGHQKKCRPVLSTHFNGGKKDIMARLHSIMASGSKKSGVLPLCLLVAVLLLSSCTAPSETEVLSGYLVIRGDTLYFDQVEIIRTEDTQRIAELGLEEQRDMPDGFFIYNEKEEETAYTLTGETIYTFTDMELLFVKEEDGRRLYTTTDKEEFLQHLGVYNLNDTPLSEQTIPYFIEIRNGKVISVKEEFEFTI